MKSEKGFSILEVCIAMFLMGIVGVAYLGGLSTASKGVFIADEQATAESLARSQMEYVRSQLYSAVQWNYTVSSSERSSADPPDWFDEDSNPPLLSSEYDGYSVSVSTRGLLEPGVDNCIQEIIVVVYFPTYDEEEHPNDLIIVEDYRSMK